MAFWMSKVHPINNLIKIVVYSVRGVTVGMGGWDCSVCSLTDLCCSHFPVSTKLLQFVVSQIHCILILSACIIV